MMTIMLIAGAVSSFLLGWIWGYDDGYKKGHKDGMELKESIDNKKTSKD